MPARARAFVLVLALALASAAPAAAQVNTESLRGTPQPGLHGLLDGAVLFQSGNVDLIQVAATARLEYVAGIHTPFVQGSIAFGQKGEDQDTFLDNGFVHARWTAMWIERLGTEVFGQVHEFTRLSLRALGGAGVRVMLASSEVIGAWAGTAWMIEHERLDIPETDPHPSELTVHRWTSYLTLRLALTDVLRLVTTTYAQPRFDDFSDVRVLEDVALEAAASPWLTLAVSLTVLYDSRPPAGVERLDVSLAPRLRVAF